MSDKGVQSIVELRSVGALKVYSGHAIHIWESMSLARSGRWSKQQTVSALQSAPDPGAGMSLRG
jgi:hypothetical protein